MILFYLASGIIFFGLGLVGWLLYSEKSKITLPAEEPSSSDPHRKKKEEETAAQLLNRLGFNEREPKSDPFVNNPSEKKKSGLMTALFSKLAAQVQKSPVKEEPWSESLPFDPKEMKNIPTAPAQNKDAHGTASIRTVPDPHSPEPENHAKERKWPAHVEATLELSQLKEKHERIEKLLNEKSQSLEKIEKNLETEIRNRKEFNKVKDLLEKEIKDHKVKARDIQIELTNAQAETEGFKTRVNQLEQKVTKLEKTILEFEHAEKDKTVELANLKDSLKKAESQLKAVPVPKPEPTLVQQPATTQAEAVPEILPQTPDSVPVQSVQPETPPITETVQPPPEPVVSATSETIEQPAITISTISEEKSLEPTPETPPKPPEPIEPPKEIKEEKDPVPAASDIQPPETTVASEPTTTVTLPNLAAVAEPEPKEVIKSDISQSPPVPDKIQQKLRDKQQGLKDFLKTLEEPLPAPEIPSLSLPEASKPAVELPIVETPPNPQKEPLPNGFLAPPPEENSPKERGGGKKGGKEQEYIKLPEDILKKDEIKPEDGKNT